MSGTIRVVFCKKYITGVFTSTVCEYLHYHALIYHDHINVTVAVCNVDLAHAPNADCPSGYNMAIYQVITCSCNYGYVQTGGDSSRRCMDASVAEYYWTGSPIQCSRKCSIAKHKYAHVTLGSSYIGLIINLRLCPYRNKSSLLSETNDSYCTFIIHCMSGRCPM